MNLSNSWTLVWLLITLSFYLGFRLLIGGRQSGAEERLARLYERHHPTREQQLRREKKKLDLFFEGSLSQQFTARGWFRSPSLALQLRQAGYRRTPAEHYAKKISTAAAMGVAGLLFGYALDVPRILLIVAVLFAFFAPDIQLRQDIKKRREQMLAELPGIMDLVAMTLEVGAANDALEALSIAVGDQPGALHSEIREMIQQNQLGKNKADALREFSERVGLQQIRTLVGVILQADKVGMGVAEALIQQAEQFRAERRSRALEAAAALQSKVSLPLVLSIIPLILVITGVPLVYTVLEGFR